MKLRVLSVSLLLAATALSSCKGDAHLTTFELSPDAGSAAGYRPGTPITLRDGTPVTRPGGAPVTTPKIDRRGGGNTESATEVTRSISSPTSRGGSTNTLATTGTTSLAASPGSYHLTLPVSGTYTYAETVTPDDGGSPRTRDVRFFLDVQSQRTLKWQEVKADGSPASSDYYAERFTSGDLTLLVSAPGGKPCIWDPFAVSVLQSTIDGGTKTTSSTCNPAGKKFDNPPKLVSTVGFRRIRTVVIAGKSYKCVDVSRHRVLTVAGVKSTSDAVDTYAFDLGVRVATSDHTTTTKANSTSAATRDLALKSFVPK